MNKPKLIKSWEELAELPPSKTHRLEIDLEFGCGWVVPIRELNDIRFYLSTHTFYGSGCEWATNALQACGFNVVIKNWDKGE